MTKADLVDQVTAIGDLTRRDGEVIVDAFHAGAEVATMDREPDRTAGGERSAPDHTEPEGSATQWTSSRPRATT